MRPSKGTLQIKLLEESIWSVCNLTIASIERWRKLTSRLLLFLFKANYISGVVRSTRIVYNNDEPCSLLTTVPWISITSVKILIKNICGCGDQSNGQRNIKNAKGWWQAISSLTTIYIADKGTELRFCKLFL